MKVSLAILNSVLICYCMYAVSKKWDVVTNPFFWIAFLFRLMAGISLGLIYTYYYSASDTWQFFADAKVLSTVARHDFFSYLKLIFGSNDDQILSVLTTQEFRSIFFIKIISVFCLLSLDNYWICAAYISLLTHIVSWSLYRSVTRVFPGSDVAAALAFLIFPSVIFWSSGLEKESVALWGTYLLAIIFLAAMNNEKPGAVNLMLAIPACFVLWSLKYYWAIIFFVTILTALVMKYAVEKSPLLKKYWLLAWLILFFGIGVILSFTHPNFYLDRFLEVIVSNYGEFKTHSNPDNLIHYIDFNQTWSSMVINSPWALLSGLFRPFIGEGQGLMGLMASLENLIILVLFLGSLVNTGRALRSSHRIVFLAAVSYCVVLCIFLALSTPNFGTLSRYRVGFLPFLIFIMAYQNPILIWILDKFRRRYRR